MRPAWWNTSLNPSFFGLDVRVLPPILIWFLHMNGTTLTIAIISIVVLSGLKRLGYTLGGALLRLRRIVAGRVASGNPWYLRVRY